MSAADMVALFEKLSGHQPGLRKAHARGICASGEFIPARGTPFDEAALLSQGTLPVTLRYSLGGGNPNADDRSPGTRGVGIQMTLPDGTRHNFTGNNFPVFAGKDPATFYGLLQTFLPDENGKPNPAKTRAYAAEHPSVRAHLAWQQQSKPAASFANNTFNGIHTFYYTPDKGAKIKYRWQLTPDAGELYLTDDERTSLPKNYLDKKLASELDDAPVTYTLTATLGTPEDTDTDPSQQWPADRQTVTLGTVKVTDSGGEACTPVNFDPNVLSKGFASSDDPVLRMRSPAYAISYGKRLSGN
ncbi:catalase family peroxidase [Alteromonas sp. CYL-A6]|uniref:catalase family peroxidase n=1 Tax=Alteromonas nitratireducens TaxID=3390813 RepID=UPI0034B955E6